MSSDFNAALAETLGHEGGDYHPLPGASDQNPTHKGVTQSTYDRYCDTEGKPHRSVYDIQDFEVNEIYKKYWDGAHCDSLPQLLALCAFDMSINAGPVHAIKVFQQTMGLVVDGEWGPKTEAAAYTARQSEPALAGRYQSYRLLYYVLIADQPNELTSLRSWVRRVVDFNLKHL